MMYYIGNCIVYLLFLDFFCLKEFIEAAINAAWWVFLCFYGSFVVFFFSLLGFPCKLVRVSCSHLNQEK